MAKWTGDFFNHGIYDIHIHLRGVPLLEWETEVEMDKYAILYISILHPAVRRVKRAYNIVCQTFYQSYSVGICFRILWAYLMPKADSS